MISIIITHYKRSSLLRLCLESIKNTINEIEHEIIVIDSEAERETKDFIEEKFPDVKYFSFSKNVGYSKLVNKGIGLSQGKYLFIINHDIIVLKNSISEMLDFMKKNDKVGIIGPQLLTFSNEIQKSCFRFPTIGAILARRTFFKKTRWSKEKLDDFLMNGESFSSDTKVDWVQGSAMFVRKEAIDKIGLLDERFFMYLEDTDWCRRFWKNGYEIIYLPSAQVFHYYGRASKKLGALLDILFNKYTRLHLKSFIKYLWKWRKDNKKKI